MSDLDGKKQLGSSGNHTPLDRLSNLAASLRNHYVLLMVERKNRELTAANEVWRVTFKHHHHADTHAQTSRWGMLHLGRNSPVAGPVSVRSVHSNSPHAMGEYTWEPGTWSRIRNGQPGRWNQHSVQGTTRRPSKTRGQRTCEHRDGQPAAHGKAGGNRAPAASFR